MMLKKTVSQYLSTLYTVDKMVPAVVLEASRKAVQIQLPNGRKMTLDAKSLGFAAKAVNNEKMGEDRIRRGSVIRVKNIGNGWTVVQEPLLQGALVSLDAKTGAVQALVGGMTIIAKLLTEQLRPCANLVQHFKPFVYSAALAKA